MGTESETTIRDKDGQEVEIVDVPPRGNGVRKSYADLTPEEREAYQAKALETRRQKTELRKIADLQAYFEAHHEQSSMIFGAKLSVIQGLLEEMTHPKGSKRAGQLDTALLDEKRLKVLLTAISEFERTGGMRASAKAETQTVNVNVSHAVSQLTRALSGGK